MDKLTTLVEGATNLRNLMTDTIAVIREDGTKQENIRALVDKGRIFVADATLQLSTSDRIERVLPSGQVEIFGLTNVHLWKGMGSIESYYEIDCEREDAKQPHSRTGTVNVHISDSPQTHINVNSTDESTSVINEQTEDVFAQLRDLIMEFMADLSDMSLLLEKVEVMERSRNGGDFTAAYKDFVAVAAAHMTVLTPVLPALTAML
jgi:hypothetical protein